MDKFEKELSNDLSIKTNPKKKSFLILSMSIGLLLIVGIIILVVWLSKSKNKTKSSEEETGKEENPGNKENNPAEDDDDSFIEKEQPELTEETKRLIAIYQRQRTEENFLNLREEVIKNYNAVLVKKENKLEELKKTN